MFETSFTFFHFLVYNLMPSCIATIKQAVMAVGCHTLSLCGCGMREEQYYVYCTSSILWDVVNILNMILSDI